ncbi:NADP-dependent isocitrate dehydrogenase [Arachidicoccus sp.]|uniref:NADP-dependent isocitrate dehydrogenase n=1 Tax=Arachidicoccus sp. TaxID=1872624 RepID=UPI003D219094
MIKIAIAKGDGIGPEIMEAVLKIFDAAKVPLEYQFVEMGKWVFDKGFNNGMTPDAKNTIETLGILFKGPMETPKGKGVKSINVTARKTWNTYANKRAFQTLHGVDTVFSEAGISIDLTVVRENIEDTYGGIEHMLTSDVAISRRIISKPGSEQVIRYAFEIAKQKSAKRISCAHKANIMKLTDGIFLNTFYEIAKEYPELKADDIIVDDLCMKLVTHPEIFDVLVLTNLQGDIISDLCAGLVGGLGFAPSANIGDDICIFEAVHGTAPDIAGRNIANPTALLLSGIAMLNHLGLTASAATIENALLYTLENGNHTGDFGNKSIPSLNTTAFADVIIRNFGKVPKTNSKKVTVDHPKQQFVAKLNENLMMETVNAPKESIAGVDFFIQCDRQPNEVAKIAEMYNSDRYKLINISNRGTQVWPAGSMYTNLVNQYTIRFESNDNLGLSQQEIVELYAKVIKDFKVCSVETLLLLDGNKAYSLAQGQ